MATKPNANKFSRLKLKIHRVRTDISFLKKCKQHKVFPTFMMIKCVITNKVTEKVKEYAMKKWLDLEIKSLFSKLNQLELETYSLHLMITRNLCGAEYSAWLEFLMRVEFQIDRMREKKTKVLDKKLNKLLQNRTESRPRIEMVPDYVNNFSSVNFSEQELAVLNKGLKYTPSPVYENISQKIVDIEVAIKTLPDFKKEEIRNKAKTVLVEERRNKGKNSNNKGQQEANIIKELKKKEVYYLKADKGNSLVILDKSDYDERMLNTLNEGNFKMLKRNPISRMTRDANNIVNQISKVFNIPKWKLVNSNPRTPLMYGLPKIHKPGNKMRMICSNTNAPSIKIAKWLVQEFTTLEQPAGLYIKNSIEAIERLGNIVLEHDEILASFDVTALYPNVPIPDALDIVHEWLNEQVKSKEKISTMMEALSLCMKQSQFRFRDNYYEQTFGTTMGNPISCFLANAFLGKMETDLSIEGELPKVWLRYVDDVIVVIKRDNIKKLRTKLNSLYESIEFTVEIETENKLPFLDLLLYREDNRIKFDIYRKPSSTKRFITNDSYCSRQHKMAVFNSLTYRLCKVPLSLRSYKKEYDTIKEIAKINGFRENDVDYLIRKHAARLKKKNTTSLTPLNVKNKKKVSFEYGGRCTEGLSKIIRKEDFMMVYRNNGQLSNVLGDPKDKVDHFEKSGIYSVKCQDCGKKYIGQTRRNIKTRHKEHMNHAKNYEPARSAVAQHMLENSHFNMGTEGLKLEKHVKSTRELDVWESLYIAKNGQNLINNDQGPMTSALFELAKGNQHQQL